jgi:hypothetical protein
VKIAPGGAQDHDATGIGHLARRKEEVSQLRAAA